MKALFKKIIIKMITWQARFLIKRSNPKIIAITGNLGKTSTKDFIYAALRKNLLSEKGDSLVLASKKSMNSDFGVPLTILRLETGWSNPFKWIKIVLQGFLRMLDKYPYKYFILEVGADTPGDIQKITEYIKPDIAVLTGFAEVPVHIEFFDNDREKLIREKKYLIENIKDKGTFIYNLDDEDCVKIAKEMEQKYEEKKINVSLKTFSIRNTEADICAFNIKTEYFEVNKYINKVIGSSANILFKNKDTKEIKMYGVIGDAIYYALLPALLIADSVEVDIEKAISHIEKIKRTNGRMKVLSGVRNSTIIDDTYNSSPKALKHGIQAMKNIKTKGNKIFVLGDMLELGDFTKVEHENIGKMLVGIADILIVSGIRARIIGDAAIENGMDREKVIMASSSIEAGRETLLLFENELEEGFKKGKIEEEIGGDIVFVKGSQGARMEKVVKMIIDNESHDPDKELVRQEKDWKLR